MIIKSNSRKEASFDQLLDYISSKAVDARTIACNFKRSILNSSPQDYCDDFLKNAAHLPPRKNGNVLYHEIVSEKITDKLDIEKQKAILHELAMKYVSVRAKGLLVWGMMHKEKDHLHYHLVISANPAGKTNRYRVVKAEYGEIQRNIESYARERYPEFTQEVLYNHKENPHHKYSPGGFKIPQGDREQQFRRRTKQATKKDKLKQILQQAFQYANDPKELERLLNEQDIRLYQRGQRMSVEYGKMKVRLSTLGIEADHQRCKERIDGKMPSLEEKGSASKMSEAQRRMEELKKLRENQKEREKEMDDDNSFERSFDFEP